MGDLDGKPNSPNLVGSWGIAQYHYVMRGVIHKSEISFARQINTDTQSNKSKKKEIRFCMCGRGLPNTQT